MKTTDDLKKFLERSKSTMDIIAREEYEAALGLAISLIQVRDAEITLLKDNVIPRVEMLEIKLGMAEE